MFGKILIVCVGNICRSPVAENLLKSYTSNRLIRSAGLAAVEGADMEPTARAVATAHGLDFPPHRARQLTIEMCRDADLILVMENRHREEVSRILPYSRGKIFLLGNFLDGLEIFDPYQRSREVFEQVHNQIAKAAKSWAENL